MLLSRQDCPQAVICIAFKRFVYYYCEDTPICTPTFWWMKSNLLEPLRSVCDFGKGLELCRVRRFLIREASRNFCCDRLVVSRFFNDLQAVGNAYNNRSCVRPCILWIGLWFSN